MCTEFPLVIVAPLRQVSCKSCSLIMRDDISVAYSLTGGIEFILLIELINKWNSINNLTAEEIKERRMAKLTTKQRNKLPKKEFALPSERKYPMPDKSHAKNAKARASQMEKKGKLSSAEKSKIDAKADKVLKGKKKG
jgi:hypothetical protein